MVRADVDTPAKSISSSAFPALVTRKGVLYQEDCLSLLARIESASLDFIFADPPFNLGKDYGSDKVRDQLSDQEYWNWCVKWLIECTRVLKPGGSLFVYHLPKWLIQIGSLLNSMNDMQFRHWIAVKMKSGFPIKNRLHPAHYGLLYYVKVGRKFKFHVMRTPSPVCRHCGELIRDYGGYRKKYKTVAGNSKVPLIRLADVWDDTGPNIHRKSRPKSMNELPISIPERAILLSTNRGDIVFDPFVGGGSTLHAAEIHQRYWIGCEIGSTANATERLINDANAVVRKKLPDKVNQIWKMR